MHRILVIFAVVLASFAVPVHADRATDSTYFDYVSGAGMSLARIKKNVITTYLHNDHLGSAAVGTGAAGTVWWTERYSPFGELLSGNPANDNLAAYTGHIRDTATGLTYMQARYYDPVVGRFLSIDPMDFLSSEGNPGYFNRYAYTFNDPINNFDPDGQQVLPRENGKTVIVYPQKTADHVDDKHSHTSTRSGNKFGQRLTLNSGKNMAIRTIESAVKDGNVSTNEVTGRKTYTSKLGGMFTSVGNNGEDSNEVITQPI